MDELSIQERFTPEGRCFGCGPANEKGLRIRSLPDSEDPDLLRLTWQPESHHLAFEGVLNGGIIGALLDCHSNWAAAWFLMRRDDRPAPPVTVTADFHVRLKRPTPLDRPVHLVARAVEDDGAKVKVEAEMHSGEKLTATCTGTFVAVPDDHPAARHSSR